MLKLKRAILEDFDERFVYIPEGALWDWEDDLPMVNANKIRNFLEEALDKCTENTEKVG